MTDRVKSILEMANGALLEQVDYEMSKIIANIRDPNADAKKVRELTIVIKFATDTDRRNVYPSYHVKPPKLAPINPITTALYISESELGDMVITELTPQIPGQYGMDGDIQEKPPQLRIVGGNYNG